MEVHKKLKLDEERLQKLLSSFMEVAEMTDEEYKEYENRVFGSKK